MAIDKRFEMILPPLTETYSFRKKRPCRWEIPTNASSRSPGSKECPFRRICLNSSMRRWPDVPAPLERLEWTYGRWIRVTQTEPTSSIIVRSEHQFTQNEKHRFAIRKHIYELAPRDIESTSIHPTWASACSAGCHDLNPDESYRMYLGFIDIRPAGGQAPIAMGLLVPPKRLRQNPDAFIISGLYGPLFGAEGFACSVYSMHDPSLTGTYCAQACVIMATAMLADRGAILRGAYSLTYHARLASHAKTGRRFPSDCIASKFSVSHSFTIGGLEPHQVTKYLNEFSNTSAFEHCLEIADGHIPVSDRLVSRIISAYVLARFPVIMAVATHEWYPRQDKKYENKGHAVLVIGIRSSGRNSNDVQELIVHDPGSMPYLQASLSRCIESSKEFQRLKNNRPAVRLIGVTDYRIRMNVWLCYKSLRGHDHYGRILQSYETDAARDILIRLCWREDLAEILFPIGWRRTIGNQMAIKLQSDLPSGRFWVIAALDARGMPQHTWLFPADQGQDLLIDYYYYNGTPDIARVIKDRLHGTDIEKEDWVCQSDQSLYRIDNRNLAAGNTEGEPKKYPCILSPSVLTSSSSRTLVDLVGDLRGIDHVTAIDLMMLRDVDIDDVKGWLGSRGKLRGPSSPDTPTRYYLAEDGNVQLFADWLSEKLPDNTRIAAFATYLPQITQIKCGGQRISSGRNVAIKALSNIVRIARILKRNRRDCVVPSSPLIVEIVAGSRLDRCTCDSRTKSQLVFEIAQQRKVEILLESLREVTNRTDSKGQSDFVFAIELEPGSTYVVNSLFSMQEICRQLQLGRFKDIESITGFNVDVAHMRIENISVSQLRPYSDRLIHAHLADHPPFMHTRDQVPGKWTPIQYGDYQDYLPYLKFLNKCAHHRRSSGGLPFSDTISLELEGCNRISWVHQGVGAIRQILAAIN